MRNSRVKNQKQNAIISNPELNVPLHVIQMDSKQMSKPAVHHNMQQAYQSNYKFFITRLNQNKQEPILSPINQGQRYASMENSRVTFNIGKSETQDIQKTPSSPYLLQKSPTLKEGYERCQQKKNRMTELGSIQTAGQSTPQYGQNKEKLSMKYTYKQKIVSQSSTQNSGVSSSNDTTVTNASSQAILNLFQQKIEKTVENFQKQIKDQSQTISRLTLILEKLQKQILIKDQQINQLLSTKNILNNRNKSQFAKYEHLNINEQKLSSSLTETQQILKEQSLIQQRINQKISKLLQQIFKNANLNGKNENRSFILKLDDLKTSFLNRRRQVKQICQIGMSIRNISSDLTEFRQILKGLKTRDRIESVQFSEICNTETEKNKNDLDDSTSYFFHVSDLQNLDRITELFVNRQGHPLQCYVDNLNQIKYKDTNTFMFNKKGDIVQLNNKEKKYYTDKGFICVSK